MDAHTSNSEPPTGTGSSHHKRRRKILSCYDCRLRKLKCDREYPACGRCRKAGQASSCSYDERAVQSNLSGSSNEPWAMQPTTSPLTSSNWSAARPLKQTHGMEHRPAVLETSQTSGTWQLLGEPLSDPKLSKQRPAVKADADTYLTPPPRIVIPTETVIFRGEMFKTQYYGGSNATSLIAHFPQLRSFMKETIMHHTSLPRVQRDLKSLQVKWKGEKSSIQPLVDFDLLCLLPDRETTDLLVHSYFRSFETMYRILHRDSFWEEYRLFWEDSKAANSSFIIILLLVMACVSCLSKDRPTYIGDSSIAREQAVLWIEVSEWWLGHQSQKSIYLAIWQIRCLLLLAKQVNVYKKKRTWTVAGTLVREAMSAGFHRDPNLLGEKVSVFDQEMRRRLWATIIELELQASIDRGMSSASAGIPTDTGTVANINDEDLTVDSETTPASKPWDEYTSTSFLHISRASFSLRVSLNSLANDLSSPFLYETALSYEELITKELEKLPPTPEYEMEQKHPLPAVARTLLDVQLRQFLILLHAPFARQADSNSRYALSRMICFNSAVNIIEQYSKLNQSADYLLLLLRHDYFRSALVICHNMYISINIKNDIFFNSRSNSLIQYVEDVLTLLEDRITRLGTGYTHYWYISAAGALLRSTISPDESAILRQQAIDRVARQYYRVLASQQDFLKAKEIVIPSQLIKLKPPEAQIPIPDSDSNRLDMSYFDSNMQQATFDQANPLEEFYFGDPAAWTFDNLWEFE